jgi:hypothetical protein
MPLDQFHNGLANIRAALEGSLSERGVTDSAVSYSPAIAEPQGTEFVVTVNGEARSQIFTSTEIEDSGEAIDAPVAMKVRMLVSHFVR